MEHTVEVCPAWAEHRRVLVERPLVPGSGGIYGAGRPVGVRGRHLLQRDSDACEGGG